MLSRYAKAFFTRLLTPPARGLLAVGIGPDVVTWIGTIGVVAGAFAFYPRGEFFVGTLVITAFEHPHDYAEHFKAKYGPAIAARANAERNGRAAEFDEALDAFCDEWNRGTDERALFEMDYLLAVGVRTA